MPMLRFPFALLSRSIFFHFATASFASLSNGIFFFWTYLRMRFSDTKHSAYELKLKRASLARSSTQPPTTPELLLFGFVYSPATALKSSSDFLSFFEMLVSSGFPSCLYLSLIHISEPTRQAE